MNKKQFEEHLINQILKSKFKTNPGLWVYIDHVAGTELNYRIKVDHYYPVNKEEEEEFKQYIANLLRITFIKSHSIKWSGWNPYTTTRDGAKIFTGTFIGKVWENR